ncbi:putative chaperone protein dnaJ1 [Mycobacterium ulcerans str. Harvey]|uniref:Chaperone protein dnaJ1 n=1 Tax=Mycobacterium ulcerans str. Harvey TaxID=1299332 RepID=A0ABP3ARI4_MYCUL|nr:putative chaperone protein dnaJ1 [Mycobacterium ulcerans str. Harvey]
MNLNDLFDAAGRSGGTNIGDLFGGLFGRGGSARPSRPAAATTWRPRPNWTSWRQPKAWRCHCG